MMEVAVLGSGPSGLIAAHAARSQACAVTLYSRPEKSELFGAQYLHQPIPYVDCGTPKVIRYVHRGAPDAYLRKVYGEMWDGTVSDEMRAQAHVAWDIRQAYDYLWDIYGTEINEVSFADPKATGTLLAYIVDRADLVINTIPRPALCVNKNHKFKGTQIYALGDSPDSPAPYKAPEGQIIYNGDESPGWYRTSTINGYSTIEWPGRTAGKAKPPAEGIASVTKPLAHSCACWIEEFPDIVHLGRMGRWQNGSLAHHVYADTIEQIMIRKEMANVG